MELDLVAIFGCVLVEGGHLRDDAWQLLSVCIQLHEVCHRWLALDQGLAARLRSTLLAVQVIPFQAGLASLVIAVRHNSDLMSAQQHVWAAHHLKVWGTLVTQPAHHQCCCQDHRSHSQSEGTMSCHLSRAGMFRSSNYDNTAKIRPYTWKSSMICTAASRASASATLTLAAAAWACTSCSRCSVMISCSAHSRGSHHLPSRQTL